MNQSNDAMVYLPRGKAEEAMQFYASILGGEVRTEPDPDEAEAPFHILSIKSKVDEGEGSRDILIATEEDDTREKEMTGSNVAELDFTDRKEFDDVWKKFIQEAKPEDIENPTSYDGVVMGRLKDPFGLNWVICYYDESSEMN